MVALLGACAVVSSPQQSTEPAATPVSTPSAETDLPSTPTPSTPPPTPAPDPDPEFSADAVQPLVYAIGSVIGWGYAEEFDASRGSPNDRCFADALLYEFLNYELYDEDIQVWYDEELFAYVMHADDMLYLLRQYIGDYPALIQPPAEQFIFMNEDGDYYYGGSDKGLTDYKMEVETVTYMGGHIFEVTAALYEQDLEDDAAGSVTFLNNYVLRFSKAEDSAYGYTIIGCKAA